MSLLNDISSLFFPPVCPVCGETLRQGEYFICNSCRWNAPLTGFERQADNPVAQKFWGLIKVENACALMYYIHESSFRSLIHGFKYRGQWKSAFLAGKWLGSLLLESPLYKNIDIIVPIPLHVRKKLKRGYNQTEYIARGMAHIMHLPVDTNSVIRNTYNSSQALKPHHERWKNVENIFKVKYPKHLQGKHILLIDDVLTTGATICSCAETIINAVPDCRISIACLATVTDTIK